jgi:hypothetical protein
MLRWSSRLRDALHQQRIRIHAAALEPVLRMREAEFSTSGNGQFPDSFRWDTLTYCFKLGRDFAFLFKNNDPSALEIQASSPAYGAVRALSGTPITDLSKMGIDVLWLSPTIFISSIALTVDYLFVAEYELVFSERESSEVISMYIYSVSSFGRGELDEPSLAPALFLRHVCAPLPANYFSEVRIVRYKSQRCPQEMIFQLHSSILPHDSPLLPSSEGLWTQLVIDGDAAFGREDLQSLFSQRFHPSIKLGFDLSADQFHGLASIATLSELLVLPEQPGSLRAINLPSSLVDVEDSEDSLFFEYLSLKSLKSPDLSICYDQSTMSSECLHTLATTHSANDVKMILHPTLWEADVEKGRRLLRSYIEPLMSKHSTVETLFVSFEGGNDDAEEVAREIPASVGKCRSANLC